MTNTPPPEPPPQPQYPSQPPAPAGYAPFRPQPPQRLDGAYYGIGLVILLSVVTCGIWTWVWSYRTGEDLKRYNGEGFGGVLTLVLAIFISPVVMFTIPNEIEHMYQRAGRQSPVSTLLGLWFLLPIIGNIIWYVKVQRALNEFWLSVGSQPAA